MTRRILLTLLLALLVLPSNAQIVNHLKVSKEVFELYAQKRFDRYNPGNLERADSLYQAGVLRDSYRLKCLGLSLEFPVRFAQGDYARMDEAVAEIKE